MPLRPSLVGLARRTLYAARTACLRTFDVCFAAWSNWLEHDGFSASAAMAFYAGVSLLPTIILTSAALGPLLRWSPAWQGGGHEIVEILERNVSPWVAEQLAGILQGVGDSPPLASPAGLATLVVAALAIFSQVDSLFANVWEYRRPWFGWLDWIHRALWDRAFALLLLVLVGVLAAVLFLLEVALVGWRRYLTAYPGGDLAWVAAYESIPTLSAPILLTLIYKFLPPARVKWSHALAGGLSVGVLWEVGHHAFENFVLGDKYNLYGVVGSFLALMMWVYYLCAVVLWGAELVRVLPLPSPSPAVVPSPTIAPPNAAAPPGPHRP